MKIAKDHGFLDVANGFYLQDADGYMTLPVKGGVRLKENYVGIHTLEHAAKIGFGSRNYRLVELK